MSNPGLKPATEEHPLPKRKLKTKLKVCFNKEQARKIKATLFEHMENNDVGLVVDPETCGGRVYIEELDPHKVHLDMDCSRRSGYFEKYFNTWKYKPIMLIVVGPTKQRLANEIDEYLDTGQGELEFTYDYNDRSWFTSYLKKPTHRK